MAPVFLRHPVAATSAFQVTVVDCRLQQGARSIVYRALPSRLLELLELKKNSISIII